MTDMKTDFKKQHLDNYKNALREILKNNSTILVDEDILSLVKKPPLDSMDAIKCKFLSLAKKQKIVLDEKKLDKMIDDYRSSVAIEIKKIKEDRISKFNQIIDNFTPQKDSDIIKFNKKDFNEFNKLVKKNLKDKIKAILEKNIVNNVNKIFTKDTDQAERDFVITNISNFLTKNYVKQLLESIDFKVLVKDTTLINGVKEQGERYIFTNMNSYLLK